MALPGRFPPDAVQYDRSWSSAGGLAAHPKRTYPDCLKRDLDPLAANRSVVGNLLKELIHINAWAPTW